MTRYHSLAEFWFFAEQVTGIDAATLIRASRVDLADSALHAPQAGFGDEDFTRTSTTSRGVGVSDSRFGRLREAARVSAEIDLTVCVTR